MFGIPNSTGPPRPDEPSRDAAVFCEIANMPKQYPSDVRDRAAPVGWSRPRLMPVRRPDRAVSPGAVTFCRYLVEDDGSCRTLYQQTLQTSGSIEEICRITNAALWPSLRLPDRCRQAWEQAFPHLPCPTNRGIVSVVLSSPLRHPVIVDRLNGLLFRHPGNISFIQSNGVGELPDQRQGNRRSGRGCHSAGRQCSVINACPKLILTDLELILENMVPDRTRIRRAIRRTGNPGPQDPSILQTQPVGRMMAHWFPAGIRHQLPALG